jgi:hypothetical protein
MNTTDDDMLRGITQRLRAYAAALIKMRMPYSAFHGMNRDEYEDLVSERVEHLLSQELPEGDPEHWEPTHVFPEHNRHAECPVCKTCHVQPPTEALPSTIEDPISVKRDTIESLAACNRALERQLVAINAAWKEMIWFLGESQVHVRGTSLWSLSDSNRADMADTMERLRKHAGRTV